MHVEKQMREAGESERQAARLLCSTDPQVSRRRQDTPVRPRQEDEVGKDRLRTTAWCLLGARGGHRAAHAGRSADEEIITQMNIRGMLSQTSRFFGWWISFTGLYAMSGSCPCCGKQGCPAGAGIIGFILALGTLLKHPYQRIQRLIRTLLLKSKREGSRTIASTVRDARGGRASGEA